MTLNLHFYVYFFRTSTNILATRTSQYCVVMQRPSICRQKNKTNPRKNTSASKPSTAAVIAMRCFTNAWITSPTPMDSVCAEHTNACVSALIRDHIRNCLTLLPHHCPEPSPKVNNFAMSTVTLALQSCL